MRRGRRRRPHLRPAPLLLPALAPLAAVLAAIPRWVVDGWRLVRLEALSPDPIAEQPRVAAWLAANGFRRVEDVGPYQLWVVTRGPGGG